MGVDMSDDRYGAGGREDRTPGTVDARGWQDPDDDLGRAFGPDTASVGVRTRSQRVRVWTLVTVGVLVVAAVIAAALWVLVGNVQTGIGGIFPKPGAALSTFESEADAISGIGSTTDLATTKTSFASYDVTALVSTGKMPSAAEQGRILDDLSGATADASGNGIHVYAIVRFGDMEIGVSPSESRTLDRLRLARVLERIDGVGTVTCDWSGDGEGGAIRDVDAGQRVTVETTATGPTLTAVQQAVAARTAAAFPDAEVVVGPPKEG
jgi:hypothetical protein